MPTFTEREDKTKRSQVQMITFGRVFSRTYNLDESEIVTDVPAKGDVQPGYGKENYETEVKECLKPHVANVHWVKQANGGLKSVVLTFIKADAYQ